MDDKPTRNQPPYTHAHLANIEPTGDGLFNVVCPHGCALGTSADAVSKERAENRVELHKLVTEPLDIKPDASRGRMGLGRYPGKLIRESSPYYETEPNSFEPSGFGRPDFVQLGTITGRIPGPGSLEVQAALDGYRKVDDSVRDALGD